MSEPASRAKAPQPAAKAPAKTKSAPLPRGQTPAKPALVRLRQALGELVTAYRNDATHLIPLYATGLRTALNGALKVKPVASADELAEIDDLAKRARTLLSTPAPTPAAPRKSEELTTDDVGIDWDTVGDSLNQIVPGIGPALTQMPQRYRDLTEAIVRTPLFAGQAFGEQWELIAPHWPEFVKTLAVLATAEATAWVLVAVPDPSMVTKVMAVVLQALLIALAVSGVVQAALEIPKQASTYAQAFWDDVKAARGDVKMIDAAALNLARLVVMLVNAIAAKLAGMGLQQAHGVFRKWRERRGELAKAVKHESVPESPEAAQTAKSGVHHAPSTRPTKAGPPSNQAHVVDLKQRNEKEASVRRSEGNPASSTSAGKSPQHESPTPKTKPATGKPPSDRVRAPVPGLYDSIDPVTSPPGWRFHDSGPHRHPDHPELIQVTTIVEGPNGTHGKFTRSYDPVQRTMVLEEAFLLTLPPWIEAGQPLKPGRGTPTVTYMSIRQMKMLGAGFGETKVVKMSGIQNVEAVMQLERMKRNGIPYSTAVAETHSVSYATTGIEQAGNRITAIRIDTRNAFPWKLSEMMDFQNMPQPQRSALLSKYKLDAHDVVMANYDIYMDVAPFVPKGTP